MGSNRIGYSVRATALAILLGAGVVSAGPMPTEMSHVSVSYPTDSDTITYMGDRDFQGAVPTDATILGVGSNIKVFQAVDVFGRRASVASQFPQVLGADESLISHNFFKISKGNDFFSGVENGGNVTFHVINVHFATPVQVDPNTILFHLLWDTNQSEQLNNFYPNPNNLHTFTDPLRDSTQFASAHEFATPPNYAFGDLAPYVTILGSGTDTLDFEATIPYDEFFKSIYETGQTVPDGLPAPHGFLEPFHFHFEYVVSEVPEPVTLVLLLPAALVTGRRRQ